MLVAGARNRYRGSKSPLASDAGNGHTGHAEEAPNDQGRTRVRARVYLHELGRTDIERQSVLEETQVSFADKTLTCRDCGQEFVWTAGEQEFYQSRGLQNPPSRCPSCRAARRAGGGGGGGGSYAGGGGGGGYGGGQREMFTATCSNCGREARVPFQPRGDKPVYCSDCFEKQRSTRSRY
jgi:CxxC-x17-CxxC domain-containing protein